MVDVDDFFSFFIAQRVRYGPANAANILVVDSAFVMGVMLLRRPNERINARRIDVVGYQLLNNANIVSVAFPHARHAARSR